MRALPRRPPGVPASARAGSTVRAGLAGTRFAATIAAVHARPGEPILVPPGGEAAFLAPYPVRPAHPGPRHPGPARPLRAAPGRGGGGARPVGAHRALRGGGRADPCPGPRRGDRPVPAARGPRAARPATPHRAASDELESLRFVLHRLAGALTGQLSARGLAATRAHLHLDLDLAFARAGTPPEVIVEQRFPEPTADAEAIERLLFARLERTPPPAAVARVTLELAGASRRPVSSSRCSCRRRPATSRLGWQLARLALTFGEDRVRRVALLDPEAPLPEARWAWRSVELDPSGSGSGR